MGHQEGVAGQLQHVDAVLLAVGEAAAYKGLRQTETGRRGGMNHENLKVYTSIERLSACLQLTRSELVCVCVCDRERGGDSKCEVCN